MIAAGPGIPPRYTVADDAGALLVRSGLVSAGALDEARSRAGDDGGTIGEQLVATGQLADEALTDFYKSRLLVPQVNPNTLARLPAKVVAVIPREMAIELRAIPVSLDKENNLTVAMSDPSDRQAVDEIAVFTGSYVVRAVATQMQIAWCLAHYYGHVTKLGKRLLQPNVQATEASAIAAALSAVPGRRASPERQPRSDGVPETRPEAQQRARSVSGEIRVPGRRAPSIKPPLPDFEDEGSPIRTPEPSGPVISIEAGEPSGPTSVPDGNEPTQVSGPVISIEAESPTEEPTHRTMPAPRRRAKPAEPDPPELAARAGEVDLKTGPIRKVDVDEPRVVIADDLEAASTVDAALQARTARLENFVPPDLPDVSGEVEVRAGEERETAPQITVEVTDRPSGPVVIHEQLPEKSEPVLLERRRALEDLPTSVVVQPALIVAEEDAADADGDAEEILELPQKKPRRDRRTQLGVGVVAAATKAPVDDPWKSPGDNDPTRLDAHPAPPGETSMSDELLAAPPGPIGDDDTSPVAVPPRLHGDTPVPPPSGKVKLDNVRARSSSGDDDDYDSMAGPATAVMSAVDLDEAMPERQDSPRDPRVDVDEVDDGWGPPGTTIPPPLLGAIPGADDAPSGIIPMPNIDSAPLMVAPPVAPEVSRPDLSPQTLARTLEDATARMLELIRKLEHARDRDEVVALMIAHLGLTHRRAGFFAVRAGELSLFAVQPRPAVLPLATLRLDRPSTLQDVVGTRLPYRGPMHDDASRTFLSAVLGASPSEILLVPVSLRERVVGVLFGEQRLRHTFDDQLALAARAAGQALERILKARRG